MKLNRNPRLVLSALFAITALGGTIIAQDSRPRYSAPSSNDRGWTLPADTVISVQMNGTLSSRTARVGDKFTATVTVPVYVNGRTVIPAGSTVQGRVTQVTPAKRMNRSGTIGIDFDTLVFPDGSAVNLVGSLTSDDPETRRRIDDESRVSGKHNERASVFIGGGGAIGAVLGGISGGGKGAVLGGVAGAGAGVAGLLLSKGEEAEVPSGTPFGVQIKQTLAVSESTAPETGPEPGDRTADQPADRTAERPDRQEPIASPRDDPNRPILSRPEREAQNDRPVSNVDAPALPLSSPEMLRRAQGALKEQGYYEGEADGVMNSRTSSALRAYQREHNLQETGDLDPQTARNLGILGNSAGSDRTNTDRAGNDRVSNDSARSDRSGGDREGNYRPGNDRASNDRSGNDRASNDREGNYRPGSDRSGNDRPSNDRPVDRRRDSGSESGMSSEAVLANVMSATANRTQDGAIAISIVTQANSGGWRWIGEHVVNGDTVEVYAKAVKPSGMATQVLTRGRIDLTIRDGVQYVRRVVIHSASGDQTIALSGGRETGGGRDAVAEPGRASEASALAASNLQRKAEELLSEYQRAYGVRMTGTGVEVDNASQYREAEIELLFSIDSFVNSTQLYAKFATSFRDRESMRGATLAMARQARRTDRIMSTATTRASDALATRWDSIRQDVLKLMQGYGIGSSEIEN